MALTNKINPAAMSGMLNLTDVFLLVAKGSNNGSFT